MPMFSKFRNAKKAADEQKSAAQGSTDTKPRPAPYKHIPTHAASDSLACAPPGWRQDEDKKSIQAHHKRRNEMSRSTSGLSLVTTMHRASSYNFSNWANTSNELGNVPPVPILPLNRRFDDTQALSPLNAPEPMHIQPSYQTASLASTKSSSSRGSSMLEIPPRSPRRPRRADVVSQGPNVYGEQQFQTAPAKSRASRGEPMTVAVEPTPSRTVTVPVVPEPMPFETGNATLRFATAPLEIEATPRRTEPILSEIEHTTSRTGSVPFRAAPPSLPTYDQPYEGESEGRRLSKNSVYNNIHRGPKRHSGEPSKMSTSPPQQSIEMSPMLAPRPKRIDKWDMDYIKMIGSPYPHITAH